MARAVLFRGNLYREWLAYASDAKRIAEAFVAGINAYVDLTEQQPDLLPGEFRLLGYRPMRWQAADIVRIRHHRLTLNLTNEINRAEVSCKDRPGAPRVGLAASRARPRYRAHAGDWPGSVRAAVLAAPAGVHPRDRPSTVPGRRA